MDLRSFGNLSVTVADLDAAEAASGGALCRLRVEGKVRRTATARATPQAYQSSESRACPPVETSGMQCSDSTFTFAFALGDSCLDSWGSLGTAGRPRPTEPWSCAFIVSWHAKR